MAPASKAACVDSICSLTVIGTAGLSDFCGSEPVMATVIMQGVVIVDSFPFSSLCEPTKNSKIQARTLEAMRSLFQR